MKRLSLLLAVIAILPFADVWALNYTWGPVDSSCDGCWTDVPHWTYPYGHALPTKSSMGNATAILDNRASYEVALPPATQLVASTELTMNVQSGETLVLNALDRGLLLGAQDWTVSYFSGNPVQFNCQGNQLMQLYAESSTGPYDMLELTNTVITLKGGENSGSVTFDGGLIDFRDPCGVEWGAATLPSLVFHRAPLAYSSVVFTNGASLRGHTLRLQECGATNVLVFAGGDHYFDQVRIPYTWNQSFSAATAADTTFRLSGGATMSASTVGIGTKTSGGDTTANKTTHFIVEGVGTRFESRGNFTTSGDNSGGAGRVEVAVRDGAELALTSYFTLNSQQGTTTTVSIVDATLTCGNRFEFGKYANSALDFDATCATILAPRCDMFAGVDLSLADTVWTNCTVLNMGNSSSYQAAPVSLTVSGEGSRFGATAAAFNVGNVEHAALCIAGGTNVCKQLQIGGTASGNPTTGAANSGTLVVTGGVLDLFAGDDTRTAYIGAGWGSSGTVNVSGGLLKAVSLFTGWCGAGEINVTGGKVWATSEIRVGSQLKAEETRPSYLRISGGEVQVGSMIRLAANEGRLGTVVLNGGRLFCNEVRGEKGTSSLEADGGMIVPFAAATTLIHDITDARLGSKGLTVDSAYAVTIPQAFGNKAGVTDGALVLAGAAEKKLSAATSGEGKLVAAGGSVLFAPASGTSVTRANAAVIVTNDATLGFASSVGAVTFKSLQLGSDKTGGRLTLCSGTRLTVDSLALGSFYLNLGNAFAVGQAYPVITVNGRVDAETASAWKTAYILTGRAATTCYAFEVSDYDETSGTTVLSIVTSSPSVPSVENAWRGAAAGDASWTNAENWSGPTLDKTAVATFAGADGSVSSTVLLPESAIIGAVSFADRDYRLSGEGPLVIADTQNGRFSVASGHPSVDVSLYPSGTIVADVAKDASLTLNGRIVHGGLAKTGDGALFLNGTGSLLESGFSSSGGLFAVRDSSVFAPVDGAPSATVGGGTLRFGGDPADVEARFPFALDINAPVKTDAVVLSTSGNAVFPDGTVSSGALVKRGPGRAVFELSRYCYLSRGDGSATASDAPPADSLDFPADGTAPTTGYSGLTVFEGELRARVAEGTATQFSADANNQTVLGTRSTNEVSVPPAMVADGTYFQNYIFYSGLNAYVGEYPENARTQYIRAVNGGNFKINTLRVGHVVDSSKATYDTVLDVEADNATFSCLSQAHVLRANAALHLSARNGGSIILGSSPLSLAGPVTVDLADGSWFGRSATEAMQINSGNAVDFTANVSGGSTFACWYLNWYKSCSNVWAFNFDNGLWSQGATAPTKPIAFRVGEQVKFTARAGGMGFDVPADVTWQLYHPVYGVGGVFKRGAGTLRVEPAAGYNLAESTLTNFVDACALRCTGTSRVEAGTLVATAGADGARIDVASGATLQADGTVTGLTVSGAGALTGGTFAALTIVHQDGVVPTLDGVTAEGAVKVDLGYDAEHPIAALPKNVKLAEFSGAASTIPRWRLVGTGLRNVRGVFRTEANAVYMDAVETGLTVIVR